MGKGHLNTSLRAIFKTYLEAYMTQKVVGLTPEDQWRFLLCSCDFGPKKTTPCHTHLLRTPMRILTVKPGF